MATQLILTLMQMNIIGIYGILIVLVLRLFLKKAGSRFCCALWLVAFANLIVPTTLTGKFSLIPSRFLNLFASAASQGGAGKLASGQASAAAAAGDGGVGLDVTNQIDAAANIGAASQGASDAATGFLTGGFARNIANFFDNLLSGNTNGSLANGAAPPLAAAAAVAVAIWIAGMAVLAAVWIVRYAMLCKKLGSLPCVSRDDTRRIVTLEGIESPFLFGFLHPTIYLPTSLGEREADYVIRHEACHRRRRDDIAKAAALCVTIAYWYDPLVWVALHFLSVDLELSCDEAVLSSCGGNIRQAYAKSLLKYGAMQNRYVFTTLTFGEPSLKSRVRNVLTYKKRGIAITCIAVACVVVLAVGILIRPGQKSHAADGVSYENDYYSLSLPGEWSAKAAEWSADDACVYIYDGEQTVAEISREDGFVSGGTVDGLVSSWIGTHSYAISDAAFVTDRGDTLEKVVVGEEFSAAMQIEGADSWPNETHYFYLSADGMLIDVTVADDAYADEMDEVMKTFSIKSGEENILIPSSGHDSPDRDEWGEDDGPADYADGSGSAADSENAGGGEGASDADNDRVPDHSNDIFSV